jgi:precorrin-6B methylase 2
MLARARVYMPYLMEKGGIAGCTLIYNKDSGGYVLEQIATYHNYLTIMEAWVLRDWVRKLPASDPTLINIGAGAGTSAIAMLSADPFAQVISIDVNPKQLALERQNLELAGIPLFRCEQLLQDSAEVGRTWDRGLVDLVFIDGDHTYSQVQKDIRLWLPHIKPGGILCGHDYGFENWPGVKQAFDEEMAEFERISITDHLIGFYV